jgi:hypothetical protein
MTRRQFVLQDPSKSDIPRTVNFQQRGSGRHLVVVVLAHQPPEALLRGEPHVARVVRLLGQAQPRPAAPHAGRLGLVPHEKHVGQVHVVVGELARVDLAQAHGQLGGEAGSTVSRVQPKPLRDLFVPRGSQKTQQRSSVKWADPANPCRSRSKP